MASTNMMVGTGAALAGLGGVAAAAVLTHSSNPVPVSTTAAAPIVETQTVIVRTVEHRTKRLRAPHRSGAPTTQTATSQAPAPVIQAAPPVRLAAAPPTPVSNPAPIRTRTSGSGHSGPSGGGSDDGAEHADD